jgi:DNA-binding response OmpR family regulator
VTPPPLTIARVKESVSDAAATDRHARVAEAIPSDVSLVPVRIVLVTPSRLLRQQATLSTSALRVTIEAVDGLAELGPEHPDVLLIAFPLLRRDLLGLRRARARWAEAQIAVVDTRPGESVDRCLDAGADEVIESGCRHLPARMRAMARRVARGHAMSRIAMGDIILDREARRAWCAGVKLQLTPTEHRMLDCFFWHAPHAVSLTELSEFLWGARITPKGRQLLRVYIGYLRRKLSRSRSTRIVTERGGYRLHVEDRGSDAPDKKPFMPSSCALVDDAAVEADTRVSPQQELCRCDAF